MGPEALRVAGLLAALERRGLDVCDLGNLTGPNNPNARPSGGYRHLTEVAAWNRAVYAATARELGAGRLPILLGGDHSLSIGSIAAVARHCRESGRPLRVIWIDAHADFNTPAISPSGSLHGMPVACLCGFGPPELVMDGVTAPLEPRWVRQIGIRSVDAAERRFVHEQELVVFDMRTLDEEGMRRVMELALADLTPDTHLHVSFDVDSLDPQIAPGVGTTVAGGMSYREAQLCMEMLADTGQVGSLDVMELNPALDVRNQTAILAVELVESLFGKSTLMRKPAPPVERRGDARPLPAPPPSAGARGGAERTGVERGVAPVREPLELL